MCHYVFDILGTRTRHAIMPFARLFPVTAVSTKITIDEGVFIRLYTVLGTYWCRSLFMEISHA